MSMFDQRRYELLQEKLLAAPVCSYPFQSRVHMLKHFKVADGICFVKRDDELGFGITGSKIRKYRSLIPALIEKEIQTVIAIGSAYSNNILGIVQLLIENGIEPVLFLKESHTKPPKGNGLFIELFVPPESIHWIKSKEWMHVEQLANQYAQKQERKSFVLLEGASVLESLPGALSLPLDIIRNEQELEVEFDHLFIESGTGLMALSLILAYSWMQKKTHIHVIPVAGSQHDFLEKLSFFQKSFDRLIQHSTPFPQNFTLHSLSSHRAFGSQGTLIWNEIKETAQNEGFLLDPIYTAKLFRTARQLLGSLKGNSLLIHSGGALTLAGFQEQLRMVL